jgi:hypothetical protein
MIRSNKTLFGRMAGIVLAISLLAGICTTQTGCSAPQIENNMSAGLQGARDVVTAMVKIDPNDPRIAGVRKWIDTGQAFLDAFKAAPGACADLASRAASLVDAFTVAILPLISVSPIVAAAIVGIDVALRVIAANFHTCIQKATAAVAATAKLPGKMRPAIAAGDTDTISAADAVFKAYLATPKQKK